MVLKICLFAYICMTMSGRIYKRLVTVAEGGGGGRGGLETEVGGESFTL